VTLIVDSVVARRSVKQSCLSLSTAEAESVSLAKAAQETVWTRRRLQAPGWAQGELTVAAQDNTASVAWANDGVFSERSKHVDVRYHFTRDMTKTGKVKLKFVPTKEMIADIMTKPLQGKVLETGRAQLGIVRVGDVGIWSPQNGRTSRDADGDVQMVPENLGGSRNVKYQGMLCIGPEHRWRDLEACGVCRRYRSTCLSLRSVLASLAGRRCIAAQ
jgi:hypothetical protein